MPPHVVLLDNRDSFTFNLSQAFQELGATVSVLDALLTEADAVLGEQPRLVCIGPGPRGPAELPSLVALAHGLLGRAPLLGVCLGLQALVRATGGEVARAHAPLHGIRDLVEHEGEGLFAGLPSPLTVMRYHSLVATRLGPSGVPAPWRVTARDRGGQVMAIAHDERRAWAVQFHPESIGTEGGLDLLANALRLACPDDAGEIAVRYRAGSIPPVGGFTW